MTWHCCVHRIQSDCGIERKSFRLMYSHAVKQSRSLRGACELEGVHVVHNAVESQQWRAWCEQADHDRRSGAAPAAVIAEQPEDGRSAGVLQEAAGSCRKRI